MAIKFVRWLGAFRVSAGLKDSALWEMSQTDRQVAAEPLHKGQSLIANSKIGLALAETSRFHAGWLVDAWTEVQQDGTLRAKYKPCNRQGKKFRDKDRFLAAWNAVKNPQLHAEAIFDAPSYSSVVVKRNATEIGKSRAQRLATSLNLPLRIL